MTYKEFIAECSKRTIHASVAKENERVAAALRSRDDDAVRKALDEEF